MTQYNAYKFILCSLCLLTLAACSSNARETLGLNRQAPDEFSVVKRAPLEIPEASVLPKPRPGAQRPQETATYKQAQDVLFGAPEDKAVAIAPQTQPSSSEATLLSKAGADIAQPDIRRVVDEEAAITDRSNKPVIKRLLDIGKDDAPLPATVVNAKQEAERLRKNSEEGKAATEGNTPFIEE